MTRQTVRIIKSGKLFEPGAENIIAERIAEFVSEATALLETNVKSLTPVGVYGSQGGLLGSISGEVQRGTSITRGIVGSPSAYADVIESGRRPGAAMPPQGSLVRWIEVILGADENYAKKIEFVVRRKIAQKGFPGAFMFEQGFEKSIPAIENMAEHLGMKIAFDLGGE